MQMEASGEETNVGQQETIVAEQQARASSEKEQLTSRRDLGERLNHSWVVNGREIQLTSDVIGEGSWATVTTATFRGLCVAAKRLHNQTLSPYNIRIFKREMDMVAQVHHPNLIQFIGATLEGELIILTELMFNSVRAELKKNSLNKRIPDIMFIAEDVARALNYLHLM